MEQETSPPSPSATAERDLRTGHPLWADSNALGVATKALSTSTAVDIAIIGAGVTGAFMAHALASSADNLKEAFRRSPQILVLDRRPPLQGSTLASTAMLQWEIDLPLVELTKKIGLEKASRAYRRCYRALEDLTELVRSEHIRCAFEERATLYLAGDQYGSRALATEVEARTDLGLPSQYLSASDLRERFGIDRTGAILSQGSASANPGQLAAALLRRSIDLGTRVISPAEVLDVLADPEGVSLKLAHGVVVRARKVVFCTGYELPEMVRIPKADILSTWAIASDRSATMPDWLKSMMVWEASDPYLYFRSTPDGRIILGGEDEEDPERHTISRLLDTKAAILKKKLEQLVPDISLEPQYKWAGAFGSSTTGLPFIAPAKDMNNVWVVAGLGGNGITYSVIASQIITAAFSGSNDKDSDLYL